MASMRCTVHYRIHAIHDRVRKLDRASPPAALQQNCKHDVYRVCRGCHVGGVCEEEEGQRPSMKRRCTSRPATGIRGGFRGCSTRAAVLLGLVSTLAAVAADLVSQYPHAQCHS